LRVAFAHIADLPEAAQAVEQRPDVRRLPLGRYPYVIYYEIGPDAVTILRILRILHGARRQPWNDEA
jgi:plasmid stabilization system protein ParE